MRRRLATIILFLSVLALQSGAAGPAQAGNAAKDAAYGQNRLARHCRPPLKFAAGACVRRCPAGYRDTGRGLCRFRNMNR